MFVRLSDVSSKTVKKCILGFFGHFWAYVRQPHGPIGWARPMAFTCLNSTIPRSIHKIFTLKYWKVAILKNDLFLSWPFWFFFASSTWKLVTNYVLEWMGLNFYDYDGIQPKLSPPKYFSRQCTQFNTFLWVSQCIYICSVCGSFCLQ